MNYASENWLSEISKDKYESLKKMILQKKKHALNEIHDNKGFKTKCSTCKNFGTETKVTFCKLYTDAVNGYKHLENISIDKAKDQVNEWLKNPEMENDCPVYESKRESK